MFNILQGSIWGDLPSIYRLEVAPGAVLWHNRDIAPQGPHARDSTNPTARYPGHTTSFRSPSM